MVLQDWNEVMMIKKKKQLIFYVFMFVHIHLSVWRPQVDVKCLPLSLPPFYIFIIILYGG